MGPDVHEWGLDGRWPPLLLARGRNWIDRCASTRSNGNGIWQALHTAHWNLESQTTEAVDAGWRLGAISAVPAGPGVVRGGTNLRSRWATGADDGTSRAMMSAATSTVPSLCVSRGAIRQERLMKVTLVVLVGAALMSADVLARQTAGDTPDAHVAIARTAAGDTYQNLFTFLCTVPAARGGGPRGASPQGGPSGGGAPRGGGGRGAPERSTWYAEPVKVFDNLYFVGQSEYSAWAITTSAGIILIDTLFDYSVEEEVAVGLKKLGLDPAAIRYAVVTHPHPDHHGGARFLQERYGTRVVMSAADWDVLERLGGTKPARDLVATDGQTLTLGDTSVRLYVTPGHTPGTLSVLIPVRDGDRPHLAALWGGTGLNADRESLQAYIQSAQRFERIAREAGADIILSNHTDWDGSKTFLPHLAKRAPGSPNPYVVGTPAVQRYLQVAGHCATARVMRLN